MDTKKLLAVLVSVAMCGAAFAGCGNNADSSKAESKAESSSSQVEKMPETDEEWTQAMYDKAMVSYGNTSMMQNVIKKAQSGEKTTVIPISDGLIHIRLMIKERYLTFLTLSSASNKLLMKLDIQEMPRTSVEPVS